ncbi:MAG: DNA-processing protein DprA [Chloroflexota bacterium]|nr:DNA-processing protein DprA [Chloroflexota bacterium]
MVDRKYWVGLNLVTGIGPAKTQALLDAFDGDLKAAWNANAGALRAAGLDRRALKNLLKTRANRDLDEEMERIGAKGISILTWEDKDYPRLLKEIYDSPPVLYVKGQLLPEDEWAVAVVGTRAATAYGKEAARRIADGLARNDVTIVSGLARGIDGVAHQAALEAGGRTIAAMGCGLDIVYPPEHRHLAAQVIQHGALISEYPLGTPPEGRNFPPRNRIISGISLGAVIVEAGERSGALITADYALEQGREVFAVPGNIFRRPSRGTNTLIQEGATPALSVEDILEALNLTMISKQQAVQAIIPENETQARLLEYISADPIHVDEISQQAGLSINEVTSTLALMELKGMVRQVEGMNYVLARERSVDYVID